MIYLRNQAYPFDLDSTECDCCDEDQIPQLVNQTDVTQFQNIVDVAATSPQVIGDSTFQLTIGGGSPWTIVSPTWTIGGGQVCKALNTVASASQAFQLGVFTIGNYYQVNVTVDTLSGGTFDLTIGGNAFTVSVEGSYQFNVLASTDGVRAFGDDDVLGCISLIEAFEIYPQNVKWLIKNSAGSVVDVLDQTSSPDSFEINSNHITGYISWDELGLPDGCYTIGVADPNQNTCVQNQFPEGEFLISGASGDEASTGWLLNDNPPGSWTILLGSLRNQGGLAGVPTTASPYSAVFCAGVSYDIEVSVIAPSFNFSLAVKLGTVSGPPIIATGVHNFTIVSDGNAMVLNLLPALGAYLLNVEYVRVTLTNESDYTADACGPKINLGTHECTHLINLCHNSNVAKFNFTDSSFSPHMRLDSAIGRAKFSGDRVSVKFSNSFKENIYYNSEKTKEMQIATVSAYAHDFIHMALGAKYFGIDGIRHHFEDDEYTPTYADTDNCNAQSIIQISKSPQQNDPAIVFRDCTGVDTNCAGSFLLIEGQTENFVTLQDGGLIVINP